MIVISSGIQKSGSALYFNLTNDLLIATGGQDVRKIRAKFGLEKLMKYHNCNIGSLARENIEQLLQIHRSDHLFAVKTHDGPTKFVKLLMSRSIFKVTHIYRDPRDIVLSAMDHGEKIRREGLNHTFAFCSTMENTIMQVKKWLDKSTMEWIKLDGILSTKYEELIANPVSELNRLAEFLDIQVTMADLEGICSRYGSKKLSAFQKEYLHFGVGTAVRFRRVMNKQDLDLCNQHFSRYLAKLGYPTG
jgi:hypothetical protein